MAAVANLRSGNGAAAEKMIRERFDLVWGKDIFGIEENGVSFEQSDGHAGIVKITLIGACTQADMEAFVATFWGRADGVN